MKAVILAGGLGTRLAEETGTRPKPMVEIGGKPILWHIMKIYSAHGIDEFIVCLGYKGYVIKEYFSNYKLHVSDVTFDLASNESEIHHSSGESWKVTLVDTGDETMTGGRIKRVQKYLEPDKAFCLTYGDGLADIDISGLLDQHSKNQSLVTVSAVQPPGRFGALAVEGSLVSAFQEKPAGDGAWVNGGFFVVEPSALDLITSDQTSWENEPLRFLATNQQLGAYFHRGFWQPMDTLRDKQMLDELWASGRAPWKIWK